MDIGIPLERSSTEQRVALTPAGVDRLVRAGHRVFVEHSAGRAARFEDDEYRAAGAALSYDAEEVFGRSDLLLKVGAPTPEEYPLLREDGALMCFLRPVVAPAEGFRMLLERRVTTVAMEMIEDEAGRTPILQAISEIAGPMAIHVAAHLLESASGGRGILLGGAPGIPPAVVVILGAGTVGTTAARTALGNGAQVIVLDREIERLRTIDNLLPAGVTTMLAEKYYVSRALRFADVVVGAVMIPGNRTPHVVGEETVRQMKPGSVVVDVSIDQGGCLETSRPTTAVEPTYLHEGVVHYAVPNMTTNVARTATYALTHACLPYVLAIGALGLDLLGEPGSGVDRGIITAGGRCCHPSIAERFGVCAEAPR